MAYIRLIGPGGIVESASAYSRATAAIARVANLSQRDARVVFNALLEVKFREVLIPAKTIAIAERGCKELLAVHLEASVVREQYDPPYPPARPGSGRRIKVSTPGARRIRDTSQKARLVDPEVVREGLGAEIAEPGDSHSVWNAWFEVIHRPSRGR